MITKRFCIVLLAAAVPLLSSCNKSEETAESTDLTSYTFEADTIPSLEQVITSESGGRFIATLSPDGQSDGTEGGEDAEEESASSSSASGEDAQPAYLSYDYQQFTEGQTGKVVQSYVELLCSEEYAMVTEDEPDYTADTGSVTLSRQAVAVGADGGPQTADAAQIDTSTGDNEEKDSEDADKGDTSAEVTAPPYASCVYDNQNLFRVRVDWTPTSCLVTLDKVAGKDFQTSLLEAGEMLSFSAAKDLMYTVSPAEIGLPGDTMALYSLKPGPGFVMVDGQACLTVYVYGKNSEGTNSLMGTYFISSDGANLFRQVREGSNEVEQVILKDISPAESASEPDASSAASSSAE